MTTTTTKQYNIPVYKVSLVRDGSVSHHTKTMSSSRDAAEVFRAFLGNVDREHFLVMMLDQKHKVIGLNVVAVGSLTAAIVHPREVFKPAIVSNAAAIIVCHNHPSGDPTPSREDRELTTRLLEAGTILGIPVLDHIILGDWTENVVSFTDQGILV